MADFNINNTTMEQIAEAYNAAREDIIKRQELLQTPAMRAELNRQKELEKSAEDVINLNILSTNITGEYNDLVKKISDKRDELERLYGITIDENSPGAVAAAKSLLEDNFRQTYQTAVTSYEDESRKIEVKAAEDRQLAEDKFNEQIAALNEKLDSLIAESKITDERESSEYDYSLDRKRKIEREERENIIRKREIELSEREKSVDDEKQALEEKISDISLMQKNVESIPVQLQNARQEGIRKANKRLGHEYEYSMSLQTKDHENKMAAMENQYDRLEEKYKRLKEEMDSIAERLAKCNEESRILTGETVKSIGGINILNQDQRMHANASIK